jgi:hypothetical protein
MGNLFVVGFDEPNQAEGVHFKLQKLQSEGLVDLADVAVAVKDERGKAKLHHAGRMWATNFKARPLMAMSAWMSSSCHSLLAPELPDAHQHDSGRADD